MLEKVTQFDKDLLLAINGAHSPFWDKFMYFVSGKVEWTPLYLVLLGFIIYKYKKQSLLIILSVILLVTITDQVSVMFKNMMEQLRPCHDPELKHLVHLVKNSCGGKFGYMSSHAANTFGIAMFTSLLFNNKWYSWSIFTWATVISYSRIYLAKHFPGDVLRGMMLGLLAGYLVFLLLRYIQKKFLKFNTI